MITAGCSTRVAAFGPSFRAAGEYFLTSLTITSNMHPITSNFLGNFLAQTRSRQTLTETFLLGRDQVVIPISLFLLAIFVGTFGLALVAEFTRRRFLRARFVIFGGPM